MDDLNQFVTNALPRSLSTNDGLPYKGQKSKVLTVFKKTRYPDAFLLNLRRSAANDKIFKLFFLHPFLASTIYNNTIKNKFDIGFFEIQAFEQTAILNFEN